jgi:hypothetical protein
MNILFTRLSDRICPTKNQKYVPFVIAEGLATRNKKQNSKKIPKVLLNLALLKPRDMRPVLEFLNNLLRLGTE